MENETPSMGEWVTVLEVTPPLPPKLKLLKEMYARLEASVTHFAVSEYYLDDIQKALKSTGLTRILKHILSNTDMRAKLENQVNVISMQKLIALGRGNAEFTRSLSQGLTHKELLRLLRLVQYVEGQLNPTESGTFITPNKIVWEEEQDPESELLA